MKLLLDTIQNKNKSGQIPIWLMRQAGRYLPEYREVRKEAGSFLDLCYNPELASKVTIQPIERFNFDGSIIFSDILVVPHILGLNVEFLEGEGPRVQRVNSLSDLKNLTVKSKQESEKIQKVSKALELTRSKLDNSKTLIGFSGSPWTVSTYILSDRKNDFENCRKLAYEKSEILDELIKLIIEQTVIYLKAQIDSGAEIIQLFDSWSGLLCEDEFYKYVIEPNKIIVEKLREYNSDIPIIGFPKGAGSLYLDYAKNVNVDAMSIDQFVSLDLAKKLQEKKIIQGNLDPQVLLCNKDLIKVKVDRILDEVGNDRLIFNLGHGIDKNTKIENVEFLVNYVRRR